MTATACPTGIDLDEVEAAVGREAFKRGQTYARGERVMWVRWDEAGSLLHGKVVGHGAVYDTAAYFAGDAGMHEFEEGECSCPIGYNCKHVAALVIAADRGGRAGRPSPAAGPALGDRRGASPERPPDPVGPISVWEAPLRAMLAGPAGSATGSSLAIELSVSVSSSASTVGAPRLHARPMRPGARGGWVNGSLAWGSLESWRFREADHREDHLALARELHAVHRGRLATTSRYYHYGYGDHDRMLDLTDWDGAQLWPLLDQAIRVGMVMIHAGRGRGEVPRYRRGELVLDITQEPDGDARVAPTLQIDPIGELAGYAPLLFLGAAGHGLLMVKRPGDGGEAQAGLTEMPLRLVRLARETPVELQRMLLEDTGLRVPRDELPRFAAELAPALRNVVPVASSDGSFTVPEVSAPQLVLRTQYDGGHFARAAWGWTYSVGERAVEFALPVNGRGPGLRDLAAEQAILDELDLSATGLAGLGLLDGDGRPSGTPTLLGGFDTVRFATEALPALTELPEISLEVDGEPLDYRSVDDSLEIGIATTEIAGERDWFDLDVTITVEGQEMPFAAVVSALARGETRMLLDDGAHFSLLAPELESLRHLIEEARALGDGSHPGSLRISRYQAGLWQELVGLGVVREQAEGWRRQVERLHALDGLAQHEQPELDATLRPYQLEGFQWLATLWDLGLGGILADDMGLGKTLQALALICYALRRHGEHAVSTGPETGGRAGPFLVIAPTSVVPNWVAEADRFAPNLTVRALTDTLARAGVEIADVASEADVVVTTYTLARLDEEHYRGVEWAGVILDEAQAIKNHNAKTHAAVRRLPARFKLAITGTPMENNLGELWAVLSITAPGLFPDPKAFTEHYAKPIERHGDSERLARLRRRIQPLVKRRTKELVAAELPAKQQQILELDLHPRHRKLYDTRMQRERQRILGLLDDFDANRFTILTAITRMRQLSLHAGLVDEEHLKVPSAKLEALTEQLSDVIGGGHRALVFSQFTRFLTLVRERLAAAGIECCYLDGRTRGRGKVLAGFKQGDAPVFLISLKAGGFGLNLTEADYCFLLDPWWNPAVEAQAIDRTHRIGQTRQVMVYRLVSRQTIEQKVVALAQRKAALFRGVMDDRELFAGQITAEDIRGLLG